MAYIGREPQIGNFQVCDAISVVNGQAAYTMQVSSVNVSPETANHMIVSLNGIIQAPGTSYTVAGSTITFASNLATGDVINFIHILGSVLDLGVPSNDTVGAAQIKDDLISGTTALASEPADTDEFLVSDAGTLKRIDYSLIKGGGITEADQWRLTTSFQNDADPIASNWERNDTSFDKIGTGMTESSGIFSFPSTGIYKIEFVANAGIDGDDRAYTARINHTINNSDYNPLSTSYAFVQRTTSASTYNSAYTSGIFDVTNTTNYKVRFTINAYDSGTYTQGDSSQNVTFATFIRLGDT